MKRLIDGSILFDGKNEIPIEIEGYEIDPRNPLRIVPKWPACKHRVNKKMRLPCGKLQNGLCCEKRKINFLTRDICTNCSEREE